MKCQISPWKITNDWKGFISSIFLQETTENQNMENPPSILSKSSWMGCLQRRRTLGAVAEELGIPRLNYQGAMQITLSKMDFLLKKRSNKMFNSWVVEKDWEWWNHFEFLYVTGMFKWHPSTEEFIWKSHEHTFAGKGVGIEIWQFKGSSRFVRHCFDVWCKLLVAGILLIFVVSWHVSSKGILSIT